MENRVRVVRYYVHFNKCLQNLTVLIFKEKVNKAHSFSAAEPGLSLMVTHRPEALGIVGTS